KRRQPGHRNRAGKKQSPQHSSVVQGGPLLQRTGKFAALARDQIGQQKQPAAYQGAVQQVIQRGSVAFRRPQSDDGQQGAHRDNHQVRHHALQRTGSQGTTGSSSQSQQCQRPQPIVGQASD